jgi:hypothetical protein
MSIKAGQILCANNRLQTFFAVPSVVVAAS